MYKFTVLPIDIEIGAATIWQEARGESRVDQFAVATVICNRTATRYTSDGTIAGTCLAPNQFSGWRDKTLIAESLLAIRANETWAVVMTRTYHEDWIPGVVLPAWIGQAMNYFSPGAMEGQPSPYWAHTADYLGALPGFRFYR